MIKNNNYIVHIGFAKDDCPIGKRHYVGYFRNNRNEKIKFEAESLKDVNDNLLAMHIEPKYKPMKDSENIIVELDRLGFQIF